MTAEHRGTPEGGSLNTLAQNGTGITERGLVLIQGEGSAFPGTQRFRNRTKKKVIALVTSLSLASIAEMKKEPEYARGFWNTYYCQNYLISQNGRLYGKYCKNRFCPLCCSIRKASIINAYLPVIEKWKQPYFLTLTIKAVKHKDLRQRMKDIIEAFRLIKDKIRKRSQRGQGPKLKGIKALECNYNPQARTYNPHFHLVLETKEMGELLLNEWLLHWGICLAHPDAQWLRPVGNKERDLIETIKYGIKIFTEPDPRKDKRKQGPKRRDIYILAMYNIIQAMKGLRIFERFGFNLPKTEKKVSETRLIADYKEWEFAPEVFDWISSEDCRRLSGYILPAELEELIFNRMDTESD